MATVASTTLNVGLISAPVSLKTAKEDKGMSFNLASQNGEPVKQVYVVEETGEIVGPRDACLRGIFDGGTFYPVGSDTIKAIDDSVKIEGITVEGFVPATEVPWERAEATYFIAPAKASGTAGAAALRLLRDGLAAKGVAGIGKLTLRSKQRAFILYADDGKLFVTTLAFADTFAHGVAEAEAAIAGDPTSEQHLKLFGTLVESLSVPLAKLDEYADESAPLKEELVQKAIAGETIVAPATAKAQSATVDLAAALEASIAAAPKAKKAA